MQDIVDLLQIKIEKAKTHLSEDTLNAIASVPWQATILQMRETKGYSFDQLSNLEMETELVLCGLLAPEDYPKELESRMKITKGATNDLVNEMNNLVFSKIREELIKSTERKKIFAQKNPNTETPISNEAEKERENTKQVLNTHGIEIINGSEKPARENKETLPVPEKLELEGDVIHPMLIQKLSSSVQIPSVKTEHTLENITKTNTPPTSYPQNADPYRLPPE